MSNATTQRDVLFSQNNIALGTIDWKNLDLDLADAVTPVDCLFLLLIKAAQSATVLNYIHTHLLLQLELPAA
ncbi:MAG: hypothetical protein U5K75_00230 [Ahrensia sp.]|nr:hypothetical protein [Ahrensia sp.]